jgi:hypothetical protein
METRQTEPFLDSPFLETNARFSPDGHWVSYVSDQTGQREVYVRSFERPQETLQISTNGGEESVWSRDGTELYYREGDRFMVVALDDDGSTLRAGPPQVLFAGRYERTIFGGESSNYDVSEDGRFVMIRRNNPQTPTEIHVVLNWPEALGVSGR